MFPSVFHFLSSTLQEGVAKLEASEQDVYLRDVVEHSDPRFSRFRDSPERGGAGAGGQQGFSKKMGSKIKGVEGEKATMAERSLSANNLSCE